MQYDFPCEKTDVFNIGNIKFKEHIIVTVDAKMLGGNSLSLSSVISSDNCLNHLKSKTRPRETLTLLFCLFEICSKPEFYGMYDSSEPDQSKIRKKRLKTDYSQSFQTEEGEYKNVVDVYVENLFNETRDEETGVRFWFIVNHPSFSFNLAFQNLIEINIQRKNNSKEHNEFDSGPYREYIDDVTSLSYLYVRILAPYSGDLLDDENFKKATSKSLTQHYREGMSENTFSISLTLGIKVMNMLTPVNTHFDYKDITSYYENGEIPPYTRGLRLIKSGWVHPYVLWGCALSLNEELYPWKQDLLTHEQISLKYTEWETCYSKEQTDTFELLRDSINMSLEKNPNKIHNNGFFQLIEACMDESPSPADRACMSWYKEQSRLSIKNNENFLCFEESDGIQITDKSLSLFGNLIIEYFTWIEGPLKILSIHHVFVPTIINTTSAFAPIQQKVHQIIGSESGQGKSNLLQLLRELLIPGTFTNGSHDTKRAKNTDVNHDHFTVLNDEINRMFIDGDIDNQGNSTIKQSTSEGFVETNVNVADEKTGRRKTETVRSKTNCLIISGSNSSHHFMPPAIENRFNFSYIHSISRPDSNAAALNAKAKNEKQIERLRKRIRIVQFLSFCVYFFIHTLHILKDVDTMACAELQQDIIDYCKKDLKVYDDLNRKFNRITSYSKTIAVWFAIHKVCFMRPPNEVKRPFSFKRFIEEIQKELYVRHEHFIYALSFIDNPISDNTLWIICNGLKENFNARTDSTQNDKEYFIPMDLFVYNKIYSDPVLFYSTIESKIKTPTIHPFSRAIVGYIKDHKGKSVTIKVNSQIMNHIGNPTTTTTSTTDESSSILKDETVTFVKWGTKSVEGYNGNFTSVTGLIFSLPFIEQIAEKNYDYHLKNVIKRIGQRNQKFRYVTNFTYKYGYSLDNDPRKYPAPQFVHVYNVLPPEPGTVLIKTIRNPSYEPILNRMIIEQKNKILEEIDPNLIRVFHSNNEEKLIETELEDEDEWNQKLLTNTKETKNVYSIERIGDPQDDYYEKFCHKIGIPFLETYENDILNPPKRSVNYPQLPLFQYIDSIKHLKV
jgi:hypothetical protein